MPRSSRFTVPFATAVLAAAVAAPKAASDPPAIDWFFEATVFDEREAGAALEQVAARWRDAYASMILDIARFTRPAQESYSADVSDLTPRMSPQSLMAMPVHPGARFGIVGSRREHATTPIRDRLVRFLQHRTGHRFGDHLDRWRLWTWSLPYDPHPEYLAFKAELYRRIDPATALFFRPDAAATIRLDEIEWAGFGVNDLPPLFYPAHTQAPVARHLRDGHPVFGMRVNGEARAYPAGILAWHQLAHDRLGGLELLVVHCALSGVAAAYEAAVEGRPARFGTSGLVYRSNSLMFDEGSDTLWSTLTGEPLVGKLAGREVALPPLPVTVTTWGEWRRMHPGTTVVTAETGYEFNYLPGALLRQGLLRAGLSFPVPHFSRELRADSEVLGVRPGHAGGRPMAIPAPARGRQALRTIEVAGRRLVVLTSRYAARVYDARETRYVRRHPDGRVQDEAGRLWRAGEDALVLEGDPSARADRVPAVQAFWSAWYARFPETILAR